MKRRKFIGLLSLGLTILIVIVWIFSLNKKRREKYTVFPNELSNICSQEKIVEIGLEYRQLSGENNRDTLQNLLAYDPAISTKKFFEEKIRTDFENNNTILIQGWLLSITEARQCALLSLENQ